MSPTLFKMFLCDLPGIFRDPKCDPVTLLDDRLSCLLYADDIVILSKSAKRSTTVTGQTSRILP